MIGWGRREPSPTLHAAVARDRRDTSDGIALAAFMRLWSRAPKVARRRSRNPIG